MKSSCAGSLRILSEPGGCQVNSLGPPTYDVQVPTCDVAGICDIIHVSIDKGLLAKQLRVSVVDVSTQTIVRYLGADSVVRVTRPLSYRDVSFQGIVYLRQDLPNARCTGVSDNTHHLLKKSKAALPNLHASSLFLPGQQ
jgi:hypothetical protein